MRLRRWVLVSLVLSVGCAHYDRPDASLQVKQQDRVECRALSQQGAPPPGSLFRETLVMAGYKECLKSRGWEALP